MHIIVCTDLLFSVALFVREKCTDIHPNKYQAELIFKNKKKINRLQNTGFLFLSYLTKFKKTLFCLKKGRNLIYSKKVTLAGFFPRECSPVAIQESMEAWKRQKQNKWKGRHAKIKIIILNQSAR